MNVLIQGNAADCETFTRLCKEAGHTTDPSVRLDIAFDLHLADKAAKRALLEGATADLILAAAAPCSATEAASWSPRPDRVVGISPIFGNVIELAPALQTSPDSLERAESFLRSLNLEVARVADGPGLVRLRVLCCLINEAASAVADGVASPANIDTAMKLGANHPRGLLEWADTLGLEVVLAVLRALQADYGEDRYRPSPLLIRKVLAGQKFS
jgi:3-hydroxybutyryl-CoA dehydrogenase